MVNQGLITKDQLSLINRKNLKYPLAIAEKDYFLALISKIIFNSPLKDKLIFKGGTALHHVYLPQLRFSEDLDFSSNSTKILLDEIKNIFIDYGFLAIKKDYISNATIKIEKLQYIGPLDMANSLKVEIDFFQNVVLPPLELDYKNVYGVKTKVRIMDIREITAEKIRAMNDRARYRDYYDFVMIMQKLDVDINEVLNLVKQKEIRKTISKMNILNNWKVAKQEKQKDLLNVYFTEELKNETIFSELNKLDFE
ncbi:MAG: nucleotidyl transferase AbiEii/AbiGii toxin family protein [Patescibacteria group bacterium]|nr:nucleotidyl transferase AbiEii/AbiGii toxin family protein [Nanoarchaeota archaeon]MBU2461244.1 nucleotidyl transferase AbiEii/AbiGii toxin family protein [Patescibacteria group bacterium]